MSKTILVVDDSKSVRAVIGTTLKMGGYNVLVAEDGKQALEVLSDDNTEEIDLIISDINMPEMDGITLIKEIKKMPVHKSTPICVLTTESEQSNLEQEVHDLMDSWIKKPVQPALVLDIVGELLPD